MKRLSILFILSLIFIKCTNADYSQLSCAEKSRKFIATEGHALNGHGISTYNVNLYPECHELCLQAPRCLSYNYEYKSTSSSHVCELNDATDKMCPGSLTRIPGFKYYEEKDSTCTAKCPPSAADMEETDFQVTFPRKSIADYIRFDLQRCAPPLTAFTLCLWLNITEIEPYGAVFSYSLPNEDNEILLTDYANFKLYIAGDKSYTNNAVNNGTWRHVCTTWENTAGSWNLYIDGALLVSGDNVKTGHVIDNNGIVILGQDQDNHGGGFEEYQSFFGQMYGANMWNRVLTSEEILNMSTNCSNGVGNYLRWSDFLTGLHGNVSKTSPVACLP